MTKTFLLERKKKFDYSERVLKLYLVYDGAQGYVLAECTDAPANGEVKTETRKFNFCETNPTLHHNIDRALATFDMREPVEMGYKGDKVIRYGEYDFVGYYLNADGEVEQTKRCKTFKEVCNELDKYNAIVAELKKEYEEE